MVLSLKGVSAANTWFVMKMKVSSLNMKASVTEATIFAVNSIRYQRIKRFSSSPPLLNNTSTIRCSLEGKSAANAWFFMKKNISNQKIS